MIDVQDVRVGQRASCSVKYFGSKGKAQSCTLARYIRLRHIAAAPVITVNQAITAHAHGDRVTLTARSLILSSQCESDKPRRFSEDPVRWRRWIRTCIQQRREDPFGLEALQERRGHHTRNVIRARSLKLQVSTPDIGGRVLDQSTDRGRDFDSTTSRVMLGFFISFAIDRFQR